VPEPRGLRGHDHEHAAESRLDRGDQPGDRETLGKYLKAMNLRAWD
jgi:hypothetical protein